MENMLIFAHRENIIVEEFYLEPPLKGIYMCQYERPPIIGLSTAIEDIAEKRSIMAEELGHHFTSVGDCLPKQFYNYAHRVTVSKTEYKAMRWAANYLIPDDDLLNILKEGLCYPGELAEYFQVLPEIVDIRLKLFQKPNLKQ
jgi:Zn-dependent peptidase ImmA (M78 family)